MDVGIKHSWKEPFIGALRIRQPMARTKTDVEDEGAIANSVHALVDKPHHIGGISVIRGNAGSKRFFDLNVVTPRGDQSLDISSDRRDESFCALSSTLVRR